MKLNLRPTALVLGIFFTMAAPSWRALSAAPPSAPESLLSWLPAELIGYARLEGLGKRLESFLKSDFRRELWSTGVVRSLLSRPPVEKFTQALEDFRVITGKEPLQVFQDLLGREVAIGARLGLAGPEAVLLTRAAGEKELEAALAAVREALQNRLGFLPEPSRTTYQEQAIESYDRLSVARLGPVFAVTNSQDLLEKVIDLSAGRSRDSVQGSALFQKPARAGRDALLTVAVRPGFIPNFRPPQKLDNGLGSLLLGGWLGALEGSELLSAVVRAQEGSLDLEVSSLLPSGGLAEKYRSFFPEAARDSIARRLEKRGALAVVQLQRNLAQWWERREDLLVPRAAGDLLNFSQIMSIVFGGRNFQDEVLPEFGPTITLVARNQEYRELSEKPRPTIPAFAALFDLKSAAESGTNLTAAFQTLIGIINADRAQKKKEGGMAMLLKTEKVGEVELHTVALNLPKEAKPGLPYNFTPSLAVVGSRVVLSSSRELARILVEELGKPVATEGKAGEGGSTDSLLIDAQGVRSILDQNLDLLVADNMMKKGIGKAEAEGELKGILEVLSRLSDLRLETAKEDGAVKLKVHLGIRSSPPAGPGAPAPKEKEKAATKKAVTL